jgi:beta-glucanase (GH16 family)
MRTRVAAAVFAVLAVGGLGAIAARAAVPPTPPGWTLVWSDDFTGSAGTLPSSSNWIFDLGHSYPGGPANWGTGEIQSYTNSPANVSLDGNGNLRIIPLRDGAGNWTSARIETQRADFKPPAGGILRLEGRIQMPNVTGNAALGYWPAFWALGGPYRGTFNWPAVGEFDVMENVNGLDRVYGVLHCGVAPGGPCNEFNGIGTFRACPGSTCQSSFHTYRFEWDRSVTPNQLRWYVDGQQYHSVSQGQLPADTWNNMTSHAGYFILLNVAMGGSFPNGVAGFGTPTAATQPGVPMLVDYVAVWSTGGGTTPPPPPPPPPPTCGQLISQGRPALASSVENASLPASAAVDGNTATRWSSVFSDPQWLRVDLGTTQTISRVRLNWEAAFGRAYQIQTSPDGNAWTTVFSTATGDGGIDDLTVSGSGRYVRMLGTQRGTPWGYSLWELQVFAGCGGGGGGGPNLFLQTGGGLSTSPGGAGTNTIPSAGGGNHDGTPFQQLTYTSGPLTMTWNGGAATFDMFVDAGTAVGNGQQVRLSYDLTGNGSWDRVETYRYFATDPVTGFEHYTQASGLVSATGALGNLSGGRVRVEVWSAIGNASSALGVGNQSIVRLPFS